MDSVSVRATAVDRRRVAVGLMDACFHVALSETCYGCRLPYRPCLVDFYVRGHRLRMPPLLVYHLARKALAVERSGRNRVAGKPVGFSGGPLRARRIRGGPKHRRPEPVIVRNALKQLAGWRSRIRYCW